MAMTGPYGKVKDWEFEIFEHSNCEQLASSLPTRDT